MADARLSTNAAWADLSITSIKGIAVLVPVGGVILALRMNPHNAHFPQLREENVIGLLTGLIVIALFIERAVEVLLTPLRGTTCLKLTKVHEKAMRSQENPNSASELSHTECQLLDFKGRTRTIAYLIGLALGMAISASGVRGLASLLVLDAKDCCAFFTALDVLLTGALLAGGADGLHKIATVFTSYMEKSAEKAKST